MSGFARGTHNNTIPSQPLVLTIDQTTQHPVQRQWLPVLISILMLICWPVTHSLCLHATRNIRGSQEETADWGWERCKVVLAGWVKCLSRSTSANRVNSRLNCSQQSQISPVHLPAVVCPGLYIAHHSSSRPPLLTVRRKLQEICKPPRIKVEKFVCV